jgi:hypothetical protein
VTQSEFAILSKVSKPKLHALLIGHSFEQTMGFAREMQEGLAKYSKTVQGFDPVKGGALDVLHWVESWCREAFMKRRTHEILRQNTAGVLLSGKGAKWRARSEFEALWKRRSY